MSISDRLGRVRFRRKMEKTRLMREKMDGKVLFSHQSRHFIVVFKYELRIFACLYLDFARKHLSFLPEKMYITKVQIILLSCIVEAVFWFCISANYRLSENISPLKRKVTFHHDQELNPEIKFIQSTPLLSFFHLPKLWQRKKNERKLVAVSRETQDITKNSRSQNTFIPGMTEEYITQVPEEIEGTVTEKLYQDLAERSHLFWVLCPSVTNFSWTREYGHSLEPFREHLGRMT